MKFKKFIWISKNESIWRISLVQNATITQFWRISNQSSVFHITNEIIWFIFLFSYKTSINSNDTVICEFTISKIFFDVESIYKFKNQMIINNILLQCLSLIKTIFESPSWLYWRSLSLLISRTNIIFNASSLSLSLSLLSFSLLSDWRSFNNNELICLIRFAFY